MTLTTVIIIKSKTKQKISNQLENLLSVDNEEKILKKVNKNKMKGKPIKNKKLVV